jgi:uncharacterized membrane protein HdeD (DUF308 family)/pimeloyl-ACP methyl ester carboxylesterase
MPAVARVIRSLPRPFVAVIGVGCVVFGVILGLQPFASVEVLTILAGVNALLVGISTIATPGDHPVFRRLLGAAWLLVGLVILIWPRLTTEHLSLIVGVAMVVAGIIHGFDAVRTSTADHGIDTAAGVVGALATVALGVVALSWPDVTVFVVAVVFGAYVVWFGLTSLVSVFRHRRPQPPDQDGHSASPTRSTPRQFLRLGGRSIALALSLVLVAVSIAAHESRDDPFYATPDPIPGPPGTLIRSMPFTPADLPDGAEAWLILYSTTDSHGKPAVASASVLAAIDRPGGPRPVIAWTHGTTGVARSCAPSLATNAFDGMPPLWPVLKAGRVIVSTDYAGMGTEGIAPYLIGNGQAYSALDSIRAVHQFDEVEVSEKTVVWGHSQGGHAALWTGMLAPDYAPDVNIRGVASLSPATDLVAMAQQVQGILGGALLTAYVTRSYTRTYPDIDPRTYIRPGAWANVRAAGERCITDPSLMASVVTSLPATQSVTLADPSSGAMGDRLRQNIPTIPTQPVFIGQGTADEVIPFDITEKWVEQQCAAGASFEFQAYSDRTHMSVLDRDSQMIKDLGAWTTARFTGTTQTPTC